jgi:hypothetical protein
MFEGDAQRRPPEHGPPPAADASGHELQILTTEHWSLLSSRSLGYTEAMSRGSMFIAALTGSIVALALVAQATDFGAGFRAFGLVLLPVVFFIGVVTVLRLGQINYEDAIWVQGLNRLRHAYLERAPSLAPYFVTSKHDDDTGILVSTLARPKLNMPIQAFIALPGIVAVLDSVVAGAITGIATLPLGTAWCLALAVVTFALALAGFGLLGVRSVAGNRRMVMARFPSEAE